MSKERMYAALGATNEAILRTKAQEELFQRVCDAAVHDGGINRAIAFLAREDGFLSVAASAGLGQALPLPELTISVDPNSPHGNGLAGVAFRTGRSTVADDYQNDSRFRIWREQNYAVNVGAAAAIPIVRGGASIGVFMFFVVKAHSLSNDIMAALERMVENVSFALDVFAQDTLRKKAERATRRLADMFAALSATNTAIVRAQNSPQMFQMVCEAIAQSGTWIGSAAIFTTRAGQDTLELAAVAGAGADRIRELSISTDPEDTEGQGLGAAALRTKSIQISYDLQAERANDTRVDRDRSPYGVAAVPLVKGEKVLGLLYLFFARISAADHELETLMGDIADNISFALAGFEREEENARVSRMYAALSATNEAIMRAQTREEMCQLVCDAAVNGAKFTSTTIGLVRDGEDFFHILASAGPNATRLREIRLSHRVELPEGQGLSGTAFRSGKPSVANDYRADQRSVHWRNSPSGSQSGAGLPLIAGGKSIGFILFMSREKNTFTEQFLDLLKRLAENVSFALENFDRRDQAQTADARIKYLATHDSLTGLPNRVMFNELLDHAVARAHRNSTSFSILFLDLDRFKVINDSLGHAAGDELLSEIAQRLKHRLRESDIVARLGGDEFIIILEDVTTREAAANTARELLRLINMPMRLQGHEWRTSASIGIAMYPADGADGPSLVRNADVAMYSAKDDGKNDFRFHISGAQNNSIYTLRLEGSLRYALERNEFRLQYQPKVDVSSGRITGVEALLRWHHPELGLIAPGAFIPLAEETGLIISIGAWVLKTACSQSVAWRDQGLPALLMAVNLSPRQFADENLLHTIDKVLSRTGLDPGLLQLEITESMVMQNVERATRTLDAIRSRGVHLAIDDFGAGYSSMSLMKTFPIDTIKIDRSFIRDLAENEQDKAIANAIISMGKALGLTVVAEGVETPQQDNFLRINNCDEIQGYLYSRPVDPEEIPSILSARYSDAGAASLVPAMGEAAVPQPAANLRKTKA